MAKSQARNPNASSGGPSRSEGDFGRFDFVKWSPVMGGISIILTVVALALIFTKGMNYGIDFAGGTEMQVRFDKDVDAHQLREVIAKSGVENAGVQSFGSNKEYLIRLELPHAPTEKAQNEKTLQNVTAVKKSLKDDMGLQDAGVLRVDTVGPQIGSELKRTACWPRSTASSLS